MNWVLCEKYLLLLRRGDAPAGACMQGPLRGAFGTCRWGSCRSVAADSAEKAESMKFM